MIFREFFGNSLEILWKFFENSLEIFGNSLGIFWEFFGNSLGILWTFFGNSLEILWKFFGNFSGILWDFFGNSKTVEDLTNIDKVGKLDLTSNKEKKNQSLEARADAFSRLKMFNYSGLHFSEETSFKTHTIVNKTL